MNNHDEPPHDEHPFGGIIERALLHQYQQGEGIDTVKRRSSTIPRYRITIEHGSIRIRQDCAASAGV